MKSLADMIVGEEVTYKFMRNGMEYGTGIVDYIGAEIVVVRNKNNREFLVRKDNLCDSEGNEIPAYMETEDREFTRKFFTRKMMEEQLNFYIDTIIKRMDKIPK